MARASIEPPSDRKARNVRPIAALDSGLGEAYVSSPEEAARVCSVTNEPVTTPA